MHRPLRIALLLLGMVGCAQACTCMRPDDEIADWRRQWSAAEAVVLAEVVGASSERRTRWFSRDHVLGHDSLLRQRPVLHLIVKHRWKGGLKEGASFIVEKVDGSTCGYERWHQSREHLLYLSKRGPWQAGLCGLSHPAPDSNDAIRKMDAKLASYLGQEGPVSR